MSAHGKFLAYGGKQASPGLVVALVSTMRLDATCITPKMYTVDWKARRTDIAATIESAWRWFRDQQGG